MPPVICVVGKSNAGKTTLIEKLVSELKSRGRKVGTIKHDVHGFTIDHEGKDSYRHKAAGSWATAISSPQSIAIVQDVETELEPVEIAELYLDGCEIVIAEGYKRSKLPKIEISRAEASTELLCADEDILLAVATDHKPETKAPLFDVNDAKGIVDLIEKKFLVEPSAASAELYVNGKRVPMKGFVKDIISGSLKGMLSSLKGIENLDGTIVFKIKGGK